MIWRYRLVIFVSVLATAVAIDPPPRGDAKQEPQVHKRGEGFVEFYTINFDHNVRVSFDRRSELNKQLVKAFKERKHDPNPAKWVALGTFRFIDEKGAEVGGFLFHPLGKVKVENEYADADLEEVRATVQKHLEIVQKRLKK